MGISAVLAAFEGTFTEAKCLNALFDSEDKNATIVTFEYEGHNDLPPYAGHELSADSKGYSGKNPVSEKNQTMEFPLLEKVSSNSSISSNSSTSSDSSTSSNSSISKMKKYLKLKSWKRRS